jgi:hypothetical protein
MFGERNVIKITKLSRLRWAGNAEPMEGTKNSSENQMKDVKSPPW